MRTLEEKIMLLEQLVVDAHVIKAEAIALELEDLLASYRAELKLRHELALRTFQDARFAELMQTSILTLERMYGLPVTAGLTMYYEQVKRNQKP